MMIRYFLTALIAISLTNLAAATHGATARGTIVTSDPSAPAVDVAWMPETGKASFYGPFFHGRRTANGSRFDQMALTAAHQWLPFGTKVRVMLDGSSRSVIVTITDRIYSTRRIVDLSVGAARALGMVRQGVAQVTLAPA